MQVRDGKLLLSIPCEVWEGGFRIALVEGKFGVGNFSPEIQAACLPPLSGKLKTSVSLAAVKL